MEDKILENEKEKRLELVDLYFKSIRFNQVRGKQGLNKLKIQHKFEFAKANDKQSIRCTISTIISSEDMMLDLEVSTVGIFKIECEDQLEQKVAQLMVNIIYPNIRYQIQLITTQPGLMPIVLPIMAPKVEIRQDDPIFA